MTKQFALRAMTLSLLTLIVVSSLNLDGSAPLGTLAYSYQPTTTTLNVLFDLTTTIAADTQAVTLTLNANGAYHASAQGVLSFYLSSENKHRPECALTGDWLGVRVGWGAERADAKGF